MSARIEFDTSEAGLRAVLKDYQEIVMRAIWEIPTGLSSKQVWDKTNEGLKGKTISRASVINFLEAMREMGVLKGVEITGKGGHRWIYSPSMTESRFKVFIAETILGNLRRDFPEETRRAIENVS
jgi:Fe2+ or Zn2+ uptake regulation protein